MTTKQTHAFFSTLLILLAIHSCFPAVLLADGFRILDHSASATGQGAAVSAQADDAAAIHYNPAGLTQLKGIHFSAGTLFIGGGTTFKNSAGTKVKGKLGKGFANPPPSTLFLAADLPSLGLSQLPNWRIGIGVNSPFALEAHYPTDSAISPILTSAALPLINIKPTLAYKLNEYLSIGGGLDIYTFTDLIGEGQAEIQQIAAPGNAFGIPAGTGLEANGKDTALGFNASLLWTLLRNQDDKPLINFGFVYRHGANLNLNGAFLAGGTKLANAKTTIELPNVYTWALAGWPIRNNAREWKIEVDVEYADWSDFQDLNLRLSNGFTIPQRRNYGDAWVVMVGSEYTLLEPAALPDWDISVRTGYVHSQTPVRSQTLDPANPDSAFNALSGGIGFHCHGNGKFLGLIPCNGLGVKSIGVDLAYQAVMYQARGINNNQQPLLNGEWDTIFHVGALSMRANF
ncbi:MAG: OmpP1/FadL family transporter [Nitrospirales bacterium]